MTKLSFVVRNATNTVMTSSFSQCCRFHCLYGSDVKTPKHCFHDFFHSGARFQKIPFWVVKTLLPCGRTTETVNNFPFSPRNVAVWTAPELRRSHRYMDGKVPSKWQQTQVRLKLQESSGCELFPITWVKIFFQRLHTFHTTEAPISWCLPLSVVLI